MNCKRIPQRTPAPKQHTRAHAAFEPHSRHTSQATQRRRNAARDLVAVQAQNPARHIKSHHVTVELWYQTQLAQQLVRVGRPPQHWVTQAVTSESQDTLNTHANAAKKVWPAGVIER
jgi:hypothetical protein